MFSKEELHEIVKQEIESGEKLGSQRGGSGHLGYVSYSLEEVKTSQLTGGNIEIHYRYTLSVETEFTVYPDNPPLEYSKSKVIVVDKNKRRISEI